jgi:hypothetical protein
MTENNSIKLSDLQIGCVMNDIATASKAIERCSIILTDADDDRDIEAMNVAIMHTAQRIGLLADMVAARLAGSTIPLYGDNIEEWMMPPLYHSEVEKDQAKRNNEIVEA